MHLFFLAAGALLLAVLLLTYLTAARRRPEPRAIRDPGLSPHEADQAAALLGEALDPLGELMAHPDLGGPGFLTVQFPAGERPAASAQYPNINEGLYRRAVRRELDRQELLAAGAPAELLRLDPEFTAEGGRRGAGGGAGPPPPAGGGGGRGQPDRQGPDPGPSGGGPGAAVSGHVRPAAGHGSAADPYTAGDNALIFNGMLFETQ